MVIVNILLNRFSSPSILFMGLVLLVPILSDYYLVIQYYSYLVSCLWVLEGWSGMVNTVCPPMIPAVHFRFIVPFIIYQYRFISCWFI